jgi:dGTPase
MSESYKIRDRGYLESLELQVLSPFAARSADWEHTRIHSEPEHPYRTAFQRDRDRIIHSRAFRRLKHKRQVFLTQTGDHYRTRLTHTLEVSQLSRTIARALGVNEDLTEATALGHDLGHTPFGHIGEIVLHRIMSGGDKLDRLLSGGDAGGYKHNYQSVRVVDLIEKKYPWDGLNLTAAVREGMLKHTRLRRNEIKFPDFIEEGLQYELDHAITLEGQIVAVCDEIAQRTHDLEDGLRANFVTLGQVRKLHIVREVEKTSGLNFSQEPDPFLYRNHLIRSLVNFLVTDVLEASLIKMAQFNKLMGRTASFDLSIIGFSRRVDPLQEELDRFIASEIIATAAEKRSDERATRVIRELFRNYYQYPHLLPDYRLRSCGSQEQIAQLNSSIPGSAERIKISETMRAHPAFLRSVCDHIAGMSDNFADAEFAKIASEPEKIHSIAEQSLRDAPEIP